MKKIFLLCTLFLFSFCAFSQDLVLEKKYSFVDDTGIPLKNKEIKSYLIQTIVYNDGKYDEFEGYVSEEAYFENITLQDGSLNLKFEMEDLSSDNHIKQKKIKIKELKLYIICDGYDDNTLFVNDDSGNIIMRKKQL